jgi:predicted nuclease with TOPRIM domain
MVSPCRACDKLFGDAGAMDERHREILERIGSLATELLELSAKGSDSIDEAELDALNARLRGIRGEIDRLREEFRMTLN